MIWVESHRSTGKEYVGLKCSCGHDRHVEEYTYNDIGDFIEVECPDCGKYHEQDLEDIKDYVID